MPLLMGGDDDFALAAGASGAATEDVAPMGSRLFAGAAPPRLDLCPQVDPSATEDHGLIVLYELREDAELRVRKLGEDVELSW